AALSVYGDAARFAVPDFRKVPAQSSVLFHLAGSGPVGKAVDLAVSRVLTPFPQLHAEDCIGCGKCARMCPARAIDMTGGKPRIDRRVCIHCFCCQEFCPRGAMRVGRRFVMRLLGR
ncbi:MAG: 4Fe-4S binding protein, partial [Oscillospiraceae bacterium]|nr:4Fe-4S binding protein [Oscillospiraceae bacterium]